MPAIDPTEALEEVDEHGTWVCPECHNDGTPDGCALCRLIDGND